MERRLLSTDLCFRKQHPSRRVNSLYFDSFDLMSYRDSIEGGSDRIKKRLRWYGNLSAKTKATLEFKIKNNNQSWKKLWVKAFQIDPMQNSWSTFYKPCTDEFPVNEILKKYYPAAIVSYDRNYLISFDNKIRVTIDQNLRFYSQCISSKPNIKWSNLTKSMVVLEVKTDLTNESSLQKFFEEIPFSPSRYSKYCESIKSQIYT